MFNGKLSRLVVNQKKNKHRWQTLLFVCQKPDEIISDFPHCALPWPQYTTSYYLSFSYISINVCAEQWFVMDITFDWCTKLHHCFLLSWKSSKLFMNDLTWTLMWTPRDLNLLFVIWILREIYLFYMKSVYM